MRSQQINKYFNNIRKEFKLAHDRLSKDYKEDVTIISVDTDTNTGVSKIKFIVDGENKEARLTLS